LEEILKNDNCVSEAVVKIYACEVILALEALHKNNITYRDLKPENLV